MKKWLLLFLLTTPLLASAAPRPALIAQTGAPVINGVQASPTDVVPGDTLSVLGQGSTGMKATFDIGTRTNIPMVEDPPGIYRGVYHVTADDKFRNQTVIMHLTPKNGGATQSRATQQTITAGTKVELQSVQMDARGPVHVGDVVNITAVGTLNVQCTAQAGSQTVMMRETSPGTYTGQLRVGVDLVSGHINATLTRGTRTATKEGPLLTVEKR